MATSPTAEHCDDLGWNTQLFPARPRSFFSFKHLAKPRPMVPHKKIFIHNLLVQIHFIVVVIWWTGLIW